MNNNLGKGLNPQFLDELKGHKNLLGFSGGVDSVAMFFCLQEKDIGFDLAIIDYGIRPASKDEVSYAKKLANSYAKKCFVENAPKICSNFEARARSLRYKFFEKVIDEGGYKNLILAHHLQDRLEWFLMQLTKGSGLGTLIGFEGIELRTTYQIVRPFVRINKAEIYNYCKDHKFYEDSTNIDLSYKRNTFRMYFANMLMEKYSDGIQKTFDYLSVEKSLFYQQKKLLEFSEIVYFERSLETIDLYWIDKILKKKGYMISALQRQEIVKQNFSCEIARSYIIEMNQKYIFVSRRYNQSLRIKMPKKFRDIVRKQKIPKRIRLQIYIYFITTQIPIEAMEAYLLENFKILS